MRTVKTKNILHRFYILSVFAGFFLAFIFLGVLNADAASLSVSPTTGTFQVDNTFDGSLFLNTEGESINTIRASLEFPADKLQLVAPTTGQSIVTLWATYPQFSNTNGTILLQGGIPGGINTSRGLITKLTFRVKSVGTAMVKILDDSKVLLDNGEGTDVLDDINSGIYDLTLPPPKGPVVASETHSDQSKWYKYTDAVLAWAGDDPGVEGYSYVINNDPTNIPDDISEGTKDRIAYEKLSDGRLYFHIKSLRDGIWGGVTHFAVNIDSTPPAEFPVKVLPSPVTSTRNPIIQFGTTDNLSGIDHYETKIIPLNPNKAVAAGPEDQNFFIEAQSPFITPPLELGPYDAIVRAYDKAGNFREVMKRLKVTNALLGVDEGKGVVVKGVLTIPWLLLFIILGLLIAASVYAAWRIRRRHYWLEHQASNKKIPPRIKEKLEELKEIQAKYGKIAMMLLIVGSLLFFGNSTLADEIELGPPLVTSVSRNISNEEIFYIGGKTDSTETEVIIYIQNLESGETFSQDVVSDKRGDWFYRHDGFLSKGDYLLWVQGKAGEQMSPPSPQVRMTVQPTAIQFGASRLSYGTIYIGIIVLLLVILAGLIVYIIRQWRRVRRRHDKFIKEVKEVEEVVHRGFAVLRRDIEAELSVIKKAKTNKTLSREEELKETHLLKDLEKIERHIGKEVWDVEKLGNVE